MAECINKDENGKEFELGKNHLPFIKVSPGGSSCATCKFQKDGNCINKYFIEWYGKSTLPTPLEDYCSDWYEPKKEYTKDNKLNYKIKMIGYDKTIIEVYTTTNLQRKHVVEMFEEIEEKGKKKYKITSEKMNKGSKIKSHIYKKGNKINVYDKDLTLQIFTSSKKKTNKLKELLDKSYENISYSTTPNQLGGDIFEMSNFIKEQQIYRFGWDWGQIVEKQNLGEHGMKIAYRKGAKIVDFSKLSIEQLQADYPYKNPEWVWDNWTEKQRLNFLKDHELDFGDKNKYDLKFVSTLKYKSIREDIKTSLKKQVELGRYDEGDKIESEKNYEYYFKEAKSFDNIEDIIITKNGVEIKPYSPTDTHYPTIRFTKTELMSMAIKSFIEDEHDKESLKGMIEFLFSNR